MKNKLKERFKEKSIKKYGNKYSYTKVNYTNKSEKVTITCPTHGDFKQTPDSHLNSKYGCPGCVKVNIKVSKEEFISKSNEVHNNFYNYDNVVYINTTTPVKIICPNHGEFYQKPILHYYYKTMCPKCAIDKNRLGLDTVLSRFREIHKDKYTYSDTDNYKTIKDFITITCPTHGDFKQAVRSHLQGNGCGKCHIESNRLGKENFAVKANIVHNNKYNYDKVCYTNNKTKVVVNCPSHGDFKVRPDGHLHSINGCPLCARLNSNFTISKGEEKIIAILKELNITYIREYSFRDSTYRYDFYLPDFNILIEYDGELHYFPVDHFGGVETYNKIKESDLAKDILAEKENCYLIRVPYTKYKTLKTYLITKLKNKYRYWLIVNDKIVAYKNMLDVCNFYNLPNNTTGLTLIENMNKKFITKVLF